MSKAVLLVGVVLMLYAISRAMRADVGIDDKRMTYSGLVGIVLAIVALFLT